MVYAKGNAFLTICSPCSRKNRDLFAWIGFKFSLVCHSSAGERRIMNFVV